MYRMACVGGWGVMFSVWSLSYRVQGKRCDAFVFQGSKLGRNVFSKALMLKGDLIWKLRGQGGLDSAEQGLRKFGPLRAEPCRIETLPEP